MEVLLRSIPGILPYPDILWHLHKQVPKGLEVCQDLRDQVQSYSPALRGALRSGMLRVLLRSRWGGEETRYRSYQPWDPMEPPEVGPIWYPGLPGPEGANYSPPTHCATCRRSASHPAVSYGEVKRHPTYPVILCTLLK